MSVATEQRFFQSQINEIQRYVQQFPNEHQNKVVMRWIEDHAAEYRKHWEKHALH
ncbi:MAG: hypothetical protein HQM14_03835 [SAR324 cluster bacterium]|nr:hypothetical protein [SAR324 cluster bacterium]